MKILFLGYRPFLSEVLFNLNDFSILRQNEIDIIIPKEKKRKIQRRLFKLRKLKKIRSKLRYEKLILMKDTYLYRKKHDNILKRLFEIKDISFLKDFDNIRFLEYSGLQNIRNLQNYDFMIVASFGEKIPRRIFQSPKYGTLNIHPSFLPDLRGGYSTYIQAYDSNAITGITIHRMSDDWDNGDIVAQKSFHVKRPSTHWGIYTISGQQASSTLQQLHKNNFRFTPTKQDESLATYCNQIMQPKSSIYSMLPIDDLEAYTRANFCSHLFPFTYGVYNRNIIVILDVKEVADVYYEAKKRDVIVIKKDSSFYIKFFCKKYLITKYIFRGKMGGASNKVG